MHSYGICYDIAIMNKKNLIIRDPNILGGAPTIAGSRIPVVKILYLVREGLTLRQISKMYPHVSLKALEGTISELAQKVETQPYASKVSQTQASA